MLCWMILAMGLMKPIQKSFLGKIIMVKSTSLVTLIVITLQQQLDKRLSYLALMVRLTAIYLYQLARIFILGQVHSKQSPLIVMKMSLSPSLQIALIQITHPRQEVMRLLFVVS